MTKEKAEANEYSDKNNVNIQPGSLHKCFCHNRKWHLVSAIDLVASTTLDLVFQDQQSETYYFLTQNTPKFCGKEAVCLLLVLRFSEMYLMSEWKRVNDNLTNKNSFIDVSFLGFDSGDNILRRMFIKHLSTDQQNLKPCVFLYCTFICIQQEEEPENMYVPACAFCGPRVPTLDFECLREPFYLIFVLYIRIHTTRTSKHPATQASYFMFLNIKSKNKVKWFLQRLKMWNGHTFVLLLLVNVCKIEKQILIVVADIQNIKWDRVCYFRPSQSNLLAMVSPVIMSITVLNVSYLSVIRSDRGATHLIGVLD